MANDDMVTMTRRDVLIVKLILVFLLVVIACGCMLIRSLWDAQANNKEISISFKQDGTSLSNPQNLPAPKLPTI